MILKCQTCLGAIDLSFTKAKDVSKRLFCSTACSAKFNGETSPRRKRKSPYNREKTSAGMYKYCFRCSGELPLDRNRVFCGEGCRREFWDAVENPESDQRRGKACPRCGALIHERSTSCSPCFHVSRKEALVQTWLDGDWGGGTDLDPYALSVTIRNYLLAQANFECSRCSFDERHPDGSCILQINHIDGHANNHTPENLEVLCPNCHALTDNYGMRNLGKGRPGRARTKPREELIEVPA